jgi:hypothetical protein
MPNFYREDSLGSLSPEQIAAYLIEIGDEDEAQYFIGGAGGQAAGYFDRCYVQTGMVIGFIPPGNGAQDVVGISTVQADEALISKRIKVTLDKFFVANYPGSGVHTILCEFAGKNQALGETEELSFALRFQARDKSSPSIAGAPIFMGLYVGPDGISFKGRTVNVKNTIDDAVLATLDSPAFKSGLTLLHTAQPALKPLTVLATSLVTNVMKRKSNMQVHEFALGLDFNGSATSARLRHGSYVVVQTDEANSWDWRKYKWNADGMALHPVDDPEDTPDFNYMVFGVSPFTDAVPVPAKASNRTR